MENEDFEEAAKLKTAIAEASPKDTTAEIMNQLKCGRTGTMMCPGGGLSRPIFNKSTRFEDMRSVDEERVPYRRPAAKKLVNKAAGLKSREDDLDLAEFSRGPKSVQPSVRQHASRPSFLDGLCCPSLIED